jgi:cytochrome P450
MTTTQPDPRPYPFGEPQALDLHPEYRELREQPAMVRVQMPYGKPAWLATRYEEVKTVLGDTRFSRAQAVGDDEPRVLPFVQRPDSIFTSDPPDHNRLRKSVARAFTKRRVEAMRPGVQELVDGLLDDMERNNAQADLVTDFSQPLSIRVICNLLGVPYQDRDQIRAWADIILVNSAEVGVDFDHIVQAQLDLRGYLGSLVAKHRQQPGDDLLGVLVQTDEADAVLTDDEIIGLGVDVLIAGHESSASFISNFTYLLLTTGRYGELRDHPELMPTAVEELLRMVPLGANAFMARVATEDIEMGGVIVRAGDAVLPAMASANRDASVFSDPEDISFVERGAAHLTFGHGVHHCLGAQLGRMELQLAVGSLMQRFPGLTLAVPAEEVRWRTTMLVRGPWALPVKW